MADAPAGWRGYGEYLAWQAQDGPAGRNAAYVSMSKGWALGTAGFRQALIKDHALAAHARAWESAGAKEIREQQWRELLQRCLRRAGKTAADIRTDPKSAAWKIAIADELKRTTQASNGWLAEQLRMGGGAAVSQYVSLARRAGVKTSVATPDS